MEKKKIAVVVTVGASELAKAQALKVAQEKFPHEIVEVVDESQVPKEVKSLHDMMSIDEAVFEIKNPYKDIPLLTERFYDRPKEKRHTATLMKKGGKKQKNRYPHQRR